MSEQGKSIFESTPQPTKNHPYEGCKAKAKNLCANHKQLNGIESCILRDNKKCLIFEGDGCSYFDKAVLPVKKRRKCSCGKMLEPRRRMCDKCKEKSRKNTKKNAMQKYRQKRDGM